jgi:hypothetical protein
MSTMDYDRNTDKLHSEPPPEFTPSPIHDRVGSMNLGSPPNANGGDVSPVNGESLAQTGPPPPPASDPNAQSVDRVVNSEVWMLYSLYHRMWMLIVVC